MGLVGDFESRLEKAVEGVFSKAFRSEVEPSELGRRLLRQMESNKQVSVGAVYVPNHYLVQLSGEDFTRFEGLIPTLQTEFAELLKAKARQRRWRFTGAIDVQFEADEAATLGQFEVIASHFASQDPAEVPPDQLVMIGSDRRWDLDGDKIQLGRSSSSTVVIDDPNASRTHAELVSRNGEWWIVDLGSTNGTLVNESTIKEHRLAPGDRIKIGATDIEYRQADPGMG
ncbi:MAG: DUF3662 and FHA domain-containing protein [Actinomycetota bacterium]